MVRIFTRMTALVMGVVLAGLLSAGPAAAVDAPKWVAALYIEAQRSVGLRWMPVPGATGYKVFRSEKPGAEYKEINAAAQPQFFDQGLEPGSVYYYVLQTVAGAGVSGNSEEKKVVIPGQKQKKVAPPEWSMDPVLQETTEFGKTSFKVVLFWGKIKGALAYNVYKTLTPGKDYALLASGEENQISDVAVEAGKTYYYVLTALDGSFQETGYSAERKIVVEAEKVDLKKKYVKLNIAPRTTVKLWEKTKGADNGKFDLFEPFDLALDERGDTLYATSNSSQQVYGLKASTGELRYVIGGKGQDPGLFLYPLGLDVDGDGVLYVVDRTKVTIQTFSNGKFAKEFPLVLPPNEKVEGTPKPMDIAIDRKSGDMYVADRGINRIWVLDSAGKFQRFVGERGTKIGQIMVPEYLGFDPAGNLVVINSNQTRVSTYNKGDGAHLSSWGEARPGVGTFIFIGGFSYDKEGNIVVVDKSSSMAQGFLPDGRYLFNLANEKGDGGMPIFSPKTLLIDSKNRAFVAEGLVDRISVYQITGPVPPPQEEAPAAPSKP